MTPVEAFTKFVRGTLVTEKAERYAALALSEKGQRRILDDLCHKFEPAFMKSAIKGGEFGAIRNHPCFAYHASCGFGASFSTIAEAHDALSIADGWLILSTNGTVGIFRPEARWDDEVVISA